MPDTEPYAGLKRAAHSLIRLSNEVAVRSGVAAFTVGQTDPLQSVPTKLLRNLPEHCARVTFSQDELRALGIDLDDLYTFIFDPSEREVLRAESLGHSTLERSPVVWIGDHVYLALPTAVSMAIRRMIIEFCISAEMTRDLYVSYAKEIAGTLSGMPLLGGSSAPPLPFQRQGGIFVANLVRYVDEGRLLHICFIVDDFDAYSETVMIGINPDTSRIGKAIETSLSQVHRGFVSKPDFREGLSLLVICPWGRPLAFEFDGINDNRWRVENILAADLEAISWEPTFSPLSLWRLLDARDRLREMNVELFSVNGLLNLYAWAESLDGHLVPHGRLPDDHDPETPLTILIPQNGLLEVRKRGVESWNLHYARTWDSRDVKVRRERAEPFFEEDRNEPLYVSMDDLEKRKLVAVFETDKRGWWATIETPNNPGRDAHYRVWHANTVWLKRAAPVLEEALPGLPGGPIAWICRFDHSDTSDPSAPVPTRDEASALLEVDVQGNVIHVVAKEGFLASFRDPTKVGESLLVESLVLGALRVSGVEATADRMNALMERIVPNEWARDMHFFTAQRFRDFVQDTVPRNPILISKGDDSYSRIGLGWRARERTEGARVEGIEACCAYVERVVDSVWEKTQHILKGYNREELLMRLVANHESVMIESDRWVRTARAVLALHVDQNETARISVKRIAKFNAGSLSTRILIEMALCECPEVGGTEAGELDIGRLLANVMHLHYLGGWSEAIKYGTKKAEIRITALGDIHMQVDFDDKIANPYGQALGVKRFRRDARGYERYFRQVEIVDSARQGFSPEFWDAWTEAFGFTIDELRIFMDNIEDEAFTARHLHLPALFRSMWPRRGRKAST